MAYITLIRTKLTHNYEFLDRMFRRHRIEWAVVVKLLCGNELYLREVLQLNPRQLCDARISNLKVVKKLSPDTETVYIRITDHRRDITERGRSDVNRLGVRA